MLLGYSTFCSTFRNALHTCPNVRVKACPADLSAAFLAYVSGLLLAADFAVLVRCYFSSPQTKKWK